MLNSISSACISGPACPPPLYVNTARPLCIWCQSFRNLEMSWLTHWVIRWSFILPEPGIHFFEENKLCCKEPVLLIHDFEDRKRKRIRADYLWILPICCVVPQHNRLRRHNISRPNKKSSWKVLSRAVFKNFARNWESWSNFKVLRISIQEMDRPFKKNLPTNSLKTIKLLLYKLRIFIMCNYTSTFFTKSYMRAGCVMIHKLTNDIIDEI